MSRHVAAHRWADAVAGKLTDAAVATMDAHAERCPRCARERDRVQRASQSFPALRAEPAPELPWDSIRARIHWSVSSGRRTDRTPRRARWLGPALGVVALGALGAGGVALLMSSESSSPDSHTRPQPHAVAPSPVPSPAAPAALAAVVVRATGDTSHPFDRLIAAGDVISAGNARLDVQFDEASALALAPGAILSVRRLDSEHVDLLLQHGTLDVTVTRRSPGQRFTVALASGRTVEVRGTQFRVVEDASISRVECAHGKVALRDSSGEVEVNGARKLELGTRAQVTSVRPTELSAVELKSLVDATPLTMPVWPGAAQLDAQSSVLELSAPSAREVRVDGVELGTAPLRVRVMPGRHTVEVADHAGRFRRAGWIDAAAGTPARLDVRAEEPAPATSGIAARKKQLLASLDRARVASCTRAIAKSGVTDTYVRFEIAIDETGGVQFLNVVDTDLPSSTASCVRDAIANVRFAPGPPATFRHKLEL